MAKVPGDPEQWVDLQPYNSPKPFERPTISPKLVAPQSRPQSDVVVEDVVEVDESESGFELDDQELDDQELVDEEPFGFEVEGEDDPTPPKPQYKTPRPVSNPHTNLLRGSHRGRAPTVNRKNTVLAAVGAGQSIKQAVALAGVSFSAYRQWRDNDPEFKVKIDTVRLHRDGTKGVGWTGGFASFRDTYFRHEYPTPEFHMGIIDVLEKAPPMSISLILVPPNFGKSTLIEDWINYKLGTDPNHRMTVVSKGQGQARKMLGRIQRRCTDVAGFGEYIARFGPFYEDGQERSGKPWTRDYLTVFKADHDERDYSVQTLGWSGQIYGSRVDTLVLDDIQTRDNLTSIDKMLDKFRLEHISRIDDNGKIVIVGTRIEVGDIYEKLIDDGTVTEGQLIVMPAVNGLGESLWPERWSEEKLKLVRKNVQEKAWWCGYQQEPALAGDATFSEEMLDDAKDELRKVGSGPNGDSIAGYPVVLSLDPALGGGNALVAQAYSSDRIWVLDCVTEKGLARVEDILIRIEEFAVRYRPNVLVIEVVAFQRGLARDDRLAGLARKYGFRVVEHTTNRNKLDPILGVGSMAGSFLRSEVSIPWADGFSQVRMEPLVAELRAWRPNVPTRLLTQDVVMAMWFGWLFIMQQRLSMKVDVNDWRRNGLKKPMGYASVVPMAATPGIPVGARK